MGARSWLTVQVQAVARGAAGQEAFTRYRVEGSAAGGVPQFGVAAAVAEGRGEEGLWAHRSPRVTLRAPRMAHVVKVRGADLEPHLVAENSEASDVPNSRHPGREGGHRVVGPESPKQGLNPDPPVAVPVVPVAYKPLTLTPIIELLVVLRAVPLRNE